MALMLQRHCLPMSVPTVPPWQNPDVAITQPHHLVHRLLLMCSAATRTALTILTFEQLEELAEDPESENLSSSHRALAADHILLSYFT